MNDINFDITKLLLSDAPVEKRFVCNNGSVFKNLQELYLGLKKMSKEAFAYHVNEEKNDFSTWIYDVIGDAKLAKDIREIKNLNTIAKEIKARVISLKKNVKRSA